MSTRHFTEPRSGRPLIRVAVSSFPDLPASVGKQPGRFVLFIAGTTAKEPERSLVDTAKQLLRAGAVAVHCWGPSAGRLEICFDLAAIALFQETDPVILTSSRETGSLEHAMWEGVVAIHPDDGLDDGYERVVLAIVGSEALVRQADAYLDSGVPLLDEA